MKTNKRNKEMKDNENLTAEETEETVKADDGGRQDEEKDELTVDELIGKLAEFQKKAEEERKKAAEMTEFAQRLQAEFDNYRRRTNDNARKVREDAAADVIVKILPVMDVIAQALKMIDDEKIAKGVTMIEDEILKTLSLYGVKEIEAAGKEFDPKLHEAIMQAPASSEEERDTVKEVFQRGYMMGDKVIRPARVIVNK